MEVRPFADGELQPSRDGGMGGAGSARVPHVSPTTLIPAPSTGSVRVQAHANRDGKNSEPRISAAGAA